MIYYYSLVILKYYFHMIIKYRMLLHVKLKNTQKYIK